MRSPALPSPKPRHFFTQSLRFLPPLPYPPLHPAPLPSRLSRYLRWISRKTLSMFPTSPPRFDRRPFFSFLARKVKKDYHTQARLLRKTSLRSLEAPSNDPRGPFFPFNYLSPRTFPPPPFVPRGFYCYSRFSLFVFQIPFPPPAPGF